MTDEADRLDKLEAVVAENAETVEVNRVTAEDAVAEAGKPGDVPHRTAALEEAEIVAVSHEHAYETMLKQMRAVVRQMNLFVVVIIVVAIAVVLLLR